MYHPDNIEELNLDGFDKIEYLKDITSQKNREKNQIISIFKNSRKSYQEFKIEADNLRDKSNENEIMDYLESDEIEIFFKSFSMKDRYNKRYINKYQLSQKELSQTKWFKNKIKQLLISN